MDWDLSCTTILRSVNVILIVKYVEYIYEIKKLPA
jgi:hypothetical protein